MTRLEVAPVAREQIRRVRAWWETNRPAAPELFARELVDMLERLTRMPSLGVTYRATGQRAIRRVLLPRSRYHVYFSYDAEGDVVEVRAVWHAARGKGPPLD